MRRLLLSRIAIFIFVVFSFTFANSSDSSGVTFPIKVNWLQERFAPVDIYQSKGLNMVSPDYVSLNNHLWQLRYQGIQEETYVDSTGKFIHFSYKLGDKDLYLPYAVNLEDYYKRKSYYNLHETFTKMAIENTQKEKTQSSGKKLELIGADIAGQRVALRVSGNIKISGQMNNRERSQVQTNIQDGKSRDFKIDQSMRFNIEGTIGDRVSILVDQDSERSFDFENNMRIHYTGKEDEIIQKISAGNISLSLPGTRFVTFSSKNSGLFGIKADMKFGAINLTTIASVEKGEKQKLSYEGGADNQTNYIEDYNYIRNKYFFLDMDFRSNYWNNYAEEGRIMAGSGVVKNLEVYKSIPPSSITSTTLRNGKAYVDPNNISAYPDDIESTDFEKLELDVDYTYDANMGYIKMIKIPSDDEVLAVAYRIVDSQNENNTKKQYGDWDRDPADTTSTGIVLKLIKPRSMTNSNHPCWNLMWRNVYYLGATNIDSSGFDVQIVYDGASGNEERDKKDGETYLKKFHLDLWDASGNKGQDDVIDNKIIVNRVTGELRFPFLEPFRYDPDGKSGNPNLRDELSCTEMYTNSQQNKLAQIKSDMKFKIKVSYQNRSAIISLGPMVMEGSEEITLNGARLTRGTDYFIEYMSGTLTLMDESASNPDAKLDIKYEKNSFFQLKKKTILGARAQYDFGPDKENFIGATGLYYSKSVVEDKVDVGYEPMANFVVDLNGKYQKDLNFLTKAIDRLPLVNTDKMSNFTFEGEIAQVIPNPNTINNPETGDHNGVAYIDDFEGSKRTTSPVLTKNFWSRSAPPVEKEHATINGQNELAGHPYWYVDYTGIDIQAIWPDKDVGRNQSDRTVSPLYLCLEPEAATCIGTHATEEQKREAWGGITYFFPSSSWDQSETKYVDLWVKDYGAEGNLHIDLGIISEDQIPNGKLNTEDDKELPNDAYDPGEDIGLDETANEDEFLIVRDYNSTQYDTLYPGDEDLKKYRRLDLDDPHLDDFNYQAGSRDPGILRTSNGTEDNKRDASAGGRPDTENRNSNPSIDTKNTYVSVSIPLADDLNKYIKSETEINGKPTGWKLYRIPLTEFELNNGFDPNSFSWEDIQAMRLWLDGTSQETMKVGFAKIEMVRNEWRSMGVDMTKDNSIFIEPDTMDLSINDDNIFGVQVKNTEENEDYYPPEGVEGEYDKVQEVQRKEQSLVLKLFGLKDESTGLPGKAMASAEKDLLEDLSMINYKKIKMFINGHDIKDNTHGTYIEGQKTPLIYFLRFGKGGASKQYYEIRQPVYAGWDERNEINLDIDFMTSLKKYNTEDEYTPKNDEGLQEFWILQDEEWGEVRVYKEVKEGEYTGKKIIIYSIPAISRIRRMETGIINTSSDNVEGEVWLDELRLSDVRRNTGIASRADFKMNFADLASFNVSLDRKDADFHTVEEQPSANTSSLNNTRNFSTNANLSVDKFFPAKWGLNLPVQASLSQRESKPKYLPGTDILAGDNPPDSVISVSQSYSVNTSFSKKTSDFWLSKYTIDQLNVSMYAGWSESSDRQTEKYIAEKYSGKISYGIPFGRDNYVELLKWTEKIPFLGDKYAGTKFYYTPEKLNVSANFAENKSDKDPRIGESTYNHTMGMDHSYNLGYKLTDNVKATYARKMKNNMNNIVDDKWNNFKKLKFGVNESVTEAYNFTFSPQIFSWFAPQLGYASNYTYSDPITNTYESVQQLSNSNAINASASLNIADIFKSFYTKSSKKSTESTSSRRGAPSRGRGRSRQTTSQKETTDKKSDDDHPILDGIHGVLKKINTIQATYTINNSVNNGRRRPGNPTLAYRMGFSQKPGLDTVATENGYDNTVMKTTLNLRSGLTLIKNVNTTFSYSNQKSTSMAQNVETRNNTQDFLPMGKNGKEGIPFPSWNVRVSGLEKLPLINTFLKSLSASHAFSGKETISFKDTAEVSSSYTSGFSPLISMNMKFEHDISSDFRITTGKTITNNASTNGITITDQMGVALNLSYRRTGGITIPIPFMEKKRLDNNIDFTFGMEYSASSTKEKTPAVTKFQERDRHSSLSLKPRIGYSFTNKVTGGIFLQYQIIEDKRVGERKNMNYGFDVNIAIQG